MSSSGFSGFQGFGGSSFNLNSPDGLLALAQDQGGNIAQAANELAHPTTGILSTIGDTFKNAFTDFVNTISIPSEAVAGILSPSLSIGDAIAQHVTPSDVIFGAKDPNATVMQKVGSFLVRTATDILLDPLTYLTFGAGQGVFGLRATSEITLQEDAAKALGKEAFDTAHLSGEGQDIYKALRGSLNQIAGNTAYEAVKTGNPVLDMAQDELKTVLSNTIDSPLKPDFAKMALSNLINKAPQLTETLIDKGGLKVFGQSILSGQRIASALSMVPGMTKLDLVTKQPRMMLQALFNPAIVKDAQGVYTRIPPELTDLVQQAHDLAGSMGDARIGNITNIIQANNLTTTESKFLMASVEAGKMPADARLAKAYTQALDLSPADLSMMKKAGIPVSFLDNHAPHILVQNKMSSLPFKLPPSAAVGAAEKRTLEGSIFNAGEKGSNLAPVEAALTAGDQKGASELLDGLKRDGFEGFDDNLMTAHVARTLDNVRGTVSKYFMQQVGARFGVPADLAKDGRYVPISVKGVKDSLVQMVGKEGEQYVFHPAVASKVEKFLGSVINDDATGDLLKHFDSLQNLWKASVTSVFPAFHGRNAISNVLQNFMDLGYHVMNPATWGTSADMILKDRQASALSLKALSHGPEAEQAKADLQELMGKTMFTDSTGNAWTFGELRQVAKNNNIAFTGRIVNSSDIKDGAIGISRSLFEPESLGAKASKLAKQALPTSQEFKPFQLGRSIGTAIEEHGRLMNFVSNLRNSGDVMLASKRTKQFLFDYNNLTGFERTFMKRLLPFYTYTRKNLELQVKSFMETPGRTASLVHGLNTLGEVISGSQPLSDQEQAALPDWVKSGIGILTARNGENVTLLSSLGTPIEQPFQSLQANQLLGSLSPLIRLPLEQLSGYSFYQGKPLSDVTNATAFKNAPQFVKQLIGFTSFTAHRSDGSAFEADVALNPSMMNLLLNLPPSSRVLSAMKQMDAVDVSGQAKVLQQLIGIKPYSFDLVQEQQKRQNELKTQLQDLLTKAGVTAQFSRTFIPKAQ